jgi:protein-L-isoaspartate(D-aspartate) O-methyltransferase
LLLRREGVRYSAATVERIGFYPCAGTRDPEAAERLTIALRERDADTVRSLRRDRHKPDDSCWLHDVDLCLSSRPVH